jgi:hypothetical protein
MNSFGEFFSPLFSDLCGLCVFAGDNPSFGCGSAALGHRGEKMIRRMCKAARQIDNECDKKS